MSCSLNKNGILYQMNTHLANQHSYVIYLLANYCMPTLLKIKPSNLINIKWKDISDKISFLIEIEKELNSFGSNYSILYENEHMLILFIYNNELLKQVIACEELQYFLKCCGYEDSLDELDDVIGILKSRYMAFLEDRGNTNTEYPHEIGILLGYPLHDVMDFIKYKGSNYIFCGSWKVYHNLDSARITFQNYKNIREKALAGILAGEKLQDIIFERHENH